MTDRRSVLRATTAAAVATAMPGLARVDMDTAGHAKFAQGTFAAEKATIERLGMANGS
jgi:hypothetical protein